MKINVTKNTIQGSFWGLLNKILSILLPFVIRTIIIRKLGAEYAGLNSLFNSILQVLNLADLGIGSAMVYAMYKPILNDDFPKVSALLNFYKKAYFIIGTVILTAGLLVMPFLNYLVKGDIPSDINIYTLFVIYLFNTVSSYYFFSYYSSISFAYQRQADTSRIQLFVNTSMYVIQIILLLLFNNYYIYICLLPVGTIIYNVLVCIYTRNKYPSIRPAGTITKEEKREIGKDVFALSVYKAGGLASHSFDSIIISSTLGLALVSMYDNYYYIMNAVTGLLIIVFNALTAGIGQKLLKDSKEKIANEFSIIFAVDGLVSTICVACMFCLYQDFMVLWVGDNYLLEFGIMCLFCMYFFSHMIRKPIVMYRDAAGMWRDNMFQPLVSGLVNLFLDIVLIKVIGIYGILIATIGSMLLIDLPWETIIFLRKKVTYDIKKYFGRLILYFLIGAGTCALCFLVINSLHINNIYLRMVASLFLAIVISIGTYSLCTLFLKDNVKRIFSFMIDHIHLRRKKGGEKNE